MVAWIAGRSIPRRAATAVSAQALFLLTAMSGCEPESGAGTGFEVRDSAGIEIARNDTAGSVPSWSVDPEPRLEIGGGESGPAADLFRVTAAALLPQGGVVVADGAPRLLFFDGDGEHVRTVGRQGDGPGEFRAIAWLQLAAPDSIVVYDPALRRASVFSADGRHFRDARPEASPAGGPPPNLVGVFADGTFLGTRALMAAAPAGGAGIVRPDLVLSRHGPDGALLDSLAAAPADEAALMQGIVMRHAFLRRTHVAVIGEGFWVSSSDPFEIRLHGADGGLTRIVRKAHRPLPLSDADRAASPWPADVEIDLPATFPAISAILPGEGGGLWVEDFRRDPDEAGRWSVFDGDGRWTAVVEMPARFRPMHVGPDFVLGVWRDDLDVEIVRLHALLKRARSP